jgi:hypothetical protein
MRVSAKAPVLPNSEPRLDYFRFLVISIFAIQLLVRLVLRLLAGTGALVAVDALHKIATASLERL